MAGEKSTRTPRFVTTSRGTTSLDEASLARARSLVGLKEYVTNIPVTLMPAGEVIGSYHDPWHVEQHLTIVFTALALAGEAQTAPGCPSVTSCASYGRCARRRSRSTARPRPSTPPSHKLSRRCSTPSERRELTH